MARSDDNFIAEAANYVTGIGNELNHVGSTIMNTLLKPYALDYLENTNFTNRIIGQENGFGDLMFIMQSLGYEPLSLLGKNYGFIFDHMRRVLVDDGLGRNGAYEWPKFTFYNNPHNHFRFADIDRDWRNYGGNWRPDVTFNTTYDRGTEYSYAEFGSNISVKGENSGYNKQFENFPSSVNKTSDLIKKTNDMFNGGTMDTIIARYFANNANSTNFKDPTQTALTYEYGMSHGRNLLLNKDSKIPKPNGYINPYCRVWTYHTQYRKLQDAIRPLLDDNGKLADNKLLYGDTYKWSAFRNSYSKENGERFDKHTVINRSNGLVNIAPSKAEEEGFDAVKVKKCMFSIENLAWRENGSINTNFEQWGLSPEQKGPFGGRIMWFPPYGLSFSEDVQVNWNESTFIGRGESVYSYTNTKRTGNLNFIMLIDHPAVVDYWDQWGNVQEAEPGKQNTNEYSLLRFFAGCEILKATPKKAENTNINTNKTSVKSKLNNVESTPEKPSGCKKINVVLYFPNNFSGKDYINDPDYTVDYLMNGVGAGYYVTGTTDSPRREQLDLSEKYYHNNNRVGGYEMRNNTSISLLSSNPITNETSATNTVISSSDKIEIFSGTSNNSLYVTDDVNNEYPLTRKVWKNADNKWGTSDKCNGLPYNCWYIGRYYHDVDNNTLMQRLDTVNNYLDTNSSCLNSTGYESGATELGIKQELKEDEILVDFASLYVALGGNMAKTLEQSEYSQETVDKIRQLLGIDDTGKTNNNSIKYRILTDGRASASNNSIASHMNQDSLAANRSQTLRNWIKSKLSSDNITSGTTDKGNKVQDPTNDSNDINSFSMKAWRSAFATIEITNESNEPVSETNLPKEEVTEEEVTQPQSTEITPMRYDNEGEYFKKLKLEKPFLHHLITDKIQYFDPAFHSISPEGFNARLTFLHQCTRQGPTQGTSDFGGVANNLAFGRPPICVLRLGDFYYTKIVINHIGIQYEPLQWDLNTEGIGVMPMIAKINMNFSFIGGSDMSGPISRLQNALSFNYYANTSVYDNRSEEAEYNDNGKLTSFKPFVRGFDHDLNKVDE